MNIEQEKALALARARRRRAEASDGIDSAAPEPQAPTLEDSVIGTVSKIAGAPVDYVNALLGTTGAPVSRKPLMGSDSIEDILHAISGNRESRQIAETSPNITQEGGGAPLKERLYEGFMATPEASERYITEKYGPEGKGWYRLADRFGNPTDRIVVRGKDGSETLFNPPGVDWGDVVGMAGDVPDAVGAAGGAALSVPSYALGPQAGIPTTAVLSAGGAQAVGETVGRLFPENREAEPDIIGDVLPRAGGEFVDDILISTIMGGAGRVAKGAANYARAPFAKSASDPMAAEFRAAADRLEGQGYDIAPLPSESGAGGFVPRVEGLLEKLPGSSEKMRQYRQGGDEAIARFQKDMAGDGDASAAGRTAVSELEARRATLLGERDATLESADRAIDTSTAGLTARQGPEMSAESAGIKGRTGLEGARKAFRDEARRLYDAARAAPGGRDPIVDMAPVREAVGKIREALPPSATRQAAESTGLYDADGKLINRTVTRGGQPITEFTPPGLNRLLDGVDDIAPNMTIDQARQMRAIVDDAIDDKTILAGVPERYLGQLRQAITRAIDSSVDAAGDPALKEALVKANGYYKENIERFSRKGVAELYRPSTSAGYVEDNQIVARILSGRGNPGVIRETRDLLGPKSAEWAAVRRNAMDQILDQGRSQTLYGRRVVNVDRLVERLNGLDDETVRELFGVADAQQLRSLAADISNRTKYLDADALSTEGSPDILAQLRRAASIDEKVTREYRDNVIAPFLRGEDGARANLNPAELVPWLYRKAAPEEAAQVVGRLSPANRKTVEKGVIADIIENAIAKGGNNISAVRRLVTNQANPADSEGIAELLGAGQDVASRQQAGRIKALLSPEHRQALSDLALITAKRQERDATSSAIGGLAAGAAITSMLSRPGRVLQASIVARGLAELMTSPAFRRWLTNTRQFQLSPGTEAQSIAVAPSVFDAVSGAMAENEDVQAAMEWLNEGVSQIDESGRRVVRPPKGAGSWESYFSSPDDELRDAIMR